MKGRIVDLFLYTQTCVYVTQGVKQKDQYKYAGYKGGNGTYVVGGEYDSYVYLKVFLYSLNRCVEFDIKQELLDANDRVRISEQLVNQAKELNVGKKISLIHKADGVDLDLSQLDLSCK